jgi:multiple sugar transport system substrate-binding protein
MTEKRKLEERAPSSAIGRVLKSETKCSTSPGEEARMEGKRGFSRRDFLRLSGIAATGAIVAACTPELVKETVEVEKEVVVEQTVEVEVEKEVLVEVTSTPVPEIAGDLRLWVFPVTENDLDWIWVPLHEKFNNRYPSINVEVELLPWGGRREKMLTAFAAGEPPNMAYVNTDTISLFGRNDVLMPLDDVISEEDWADFPEDLSPGISWEGKRIMVPAMFIVSGRVANKTLMEEVGLDETQSTLDMNKLVDSVWQSDGTMLSEDTTRSLMDQEPGIEAITFLTDFFRNEWAPLEGAVGSEEEGGSAAAVDYFAMGQQMVTKGDPNISEQISRQVPDIELVFVPPYKNKEQTFGVGAGCWGVFKGTDFMEGAEAWINFMIEPENEGFYCSASGVATPRASAQKYWTAEPSVKKHVEVNLPYAAMGWDLNNWWQLQKVIGAPHWQAAALGLVTPEQACTDYAAELNVAIAEELAKEE